MLLGVIIIMAVASDAAKHDPLVFDIPLIGSVASKNAPPMHPRYPEAW